jgi:serine-type D-Ala-D-Ala carboxypeptidase (penicillin-binding protein 5/6)
LVPAGTGQAEEVEFELKAKAALLMEVNSGQIIWEENSHEQLYPASLTKIMSLLVVLEQIEQGNFSLEDRVYVSARASSMGGSEIFLSEGDELSLEELLIGMAVGSANDAAVAVAEYVGGAVESFAEMMNEKARQLEMQNTHFINPHGLHHPDHYSSAHDIMLMSLAILQYPQIHQWATIWMDEHFLQGKIKSGEVYLSNTNRLVFTYPGCDGLKTGFTREAGNGISATAQRGQTRFLAVVLGSPGVNERYEAAVKLLDYGFSRYKGIPIIDKGDVAATIHVDKGKPASLDLISRSRFGLLLPRGAEEEFTQEIVLLPVQLPLKKGDKLGELVITYGECGEAKVDLLAATDIARASQPVIFMRLLNRWLRFGR